MGQGMFSGAFDSLSDRSAKVWGWIFGILVAAGFISLMTLFGMGLWALVITHLRWV
jgi:hypothetical protein